VTPDDLLVLVPWLLFAACVVIIAVMVWRRRPTFPAAKPAKTTKRRHDKQATEGEHTGTGQARPADGQQLADGEQSWSPRPPDAEPQENH
jgi:hypothetical protein